jgi:predicted nuclease with TOPRIM domain
MDDLEALREELEEARAEAARLADRLADREARTAEMESAEAALRRELEAVHGERRAALARYRELLLAQSPELPPELVTGETLEAIDAAAQAARGLVARVREHVVTEAARSVPAGSPPRRGPDLGALSPAEKIRYGIAERQ